MSAGYNEDFEELVVRDIPAALMGRVGEDPRHLPPIVDGDPRLLHKTSGLKVLRNCNVWPVAIGYPG